MGFLKTIEVDLSSLLRWSIVLGIILAVLVSTLKNDRTPKSSIPHAPRLPYRLPLGEHFGINIRNFRAGISLIMLNSQGWTWLGSW